MATATSSTPTDAHKLTQEEWEKAVCALFTNVKLYDGGTLHPAVVQSKQIQSILRNFGQLQGRSNFWFYNPSLTALYEMNPEGVIVGVFFNDDTKHAEENFLESLKKRPRSVHSIGLNYSPCTVEGHNCAEKIVGMKYEGTKKPEIHFSQVYTKEGKKDEEGIKLLIRNDFELKVLDTKPIFQYLLKQAPNGELGEAYKSTAFLRLQRDKHIQEICEEYHLANVIAKAKLLTPTSKKKGSAKEQKETGQDKKVRQRKTAQK